MRLPVALACCGALVASHATVARTQTTGDRSLTFDVFAFSQDDELGQPFKAEGFRYAGVRLEAELPISSVTIWRTNAALAVVSNDDPETLPPTIGNANVTSASADILTLDASAVLEIRRKGSPWTWLPGIFYHHQYGYIAGGADLGVRRELGGGDATLSVTYGFRYAYPRLDYWDFTGRGRDSVTSNNVFIGWTQTISPAWLSNLSVQYTRQDGFLSDPYNYVVLYLGDVPIRLSDEVLPRTRNRLQVNARLRHSPRVGVGLGLDTSGYTDDWGIRHLAIEPSVTFPLGATRARLWYRLVTQRGTRYALSHPEEMAPHQTQDSDLSTFRTHGGGTHLSVPLSQGPGASWHYRISLFGLRRDDRIAAAGVDTGLEVTW